MKSEFAFIDPLSDKLSIPFLIHDLNVASTKENMDINIIMVFILKKQSSHPIK